MKSVVQDAAAVVADVAAGRILEAAGIAAIGGSDGSNCRSDFNRLLTKLDFGLDIYWCDIPLKDPLNKAAGVDVRETPILLPHELIGAVFMCGWKTFSSVIFGGIAECAQELTKIGEPECDIL